MISNALIIGGGSNLGLQIVEDLLKLGVNVDVLSSKDLSWLKNEYSSLKFSKVDWFSCDESVIDRACKTFSTSKYDWVYFNINIARDYTFSIDTKVDLETLNLLYFVNNLLPGIVLYSINNKIKDNTKVTWALSGSMIDWRTDRFINKHGDKTIYASTKALNYYYLVGYSTSNTRGIYVGINPGHFGNEPEAESYKDVSKKLISNFDKIDRKHSGKFLELVNNEWKEVRYIYGK